MAKKKKRYRLRLAVLYALSFLVSVAPIMTLLVVNSDRYIRCLGDAVKITFGGIVIFVILAVKTVGKLRLPGRLMTSTVLLLLCWLFSTVIPDLMLILTVWWGSEAADFVIFTPLIKRTKENILIQRTANAVKEA